MDKVFLQETLQALKDNINDLDKYSCFNEDVCLDEIQEFKGHFETLREKLLESKK